MILAETGCIHCMSEDLFFVFVAFEQNTETIVNITKNVLQAQHRVERYQEFSIQCIHYSKERALVSKDCVFEFHTMAPAHLDKPTNVPSGFVGNVSKSMG